MLTLRSTTTALALLLGALVPVAAAQEGASDPEEVLRREYPTHTLRELWRSYQTDEGALVRFYNALTERHLIEVDVERPGVATVTYFARGDADTDYLLQAGGPDFYGLRFRQIGESDYYFCTQQIPRDAWFTYGVNAFSRSRTGDGPFQTSMEHVDDGVVVGPDAPLSPHIEASLGVPSGTVREVTLQSTAMGEERTLLIYTPPGYDASQSHHLLIQLDGQNFARSPGHGPAWQGWTPLPTVLDNLGFAGEIGPTVAVLVPNQGQRSRDLISRSFTDFLALEVVAWARQYLAVGDGRVVVSGPSRAAFAAMHTALRHPTVVDGVLSQSGSFYYTLDERDNWPVYPEFEGYLLNEFRRALTLPVDFYLDVGLYDLGLGRVGVNRQLRDILELKGHSVRYVEYKGGHAHLNWRHTLPPALTYFLSSSQEAENAEQRASDSAPRPARAHREE